MTSIEKINFLLDEVETKLQYLQSTNTSSLRKHNLKRLAELFNLLELSKKHPDFDTLFNYTAINLAGIGLKNEDFGEIREGKYVQIIAIAYEVDKEEKRTTRNSSLGYYGKGERLAESDKHNIIEFVVRWRYEKSFQHSDYYEQLLEKLH
jgi:hypothetical protein